MRTAAKILLFPLLALCLDTGQARGESLLRDPREAFFLRKTGKILVRTGPNTLATYGLDGKLAHQFVLEEGVLAYDASADERGLVSCGHSHAAAWDLQTGGRLWHLGPGRCDPGIGQNGVRFAWDGRSFVSCELAAVYETGTGRKLHSVTFPYSTSVIAGSLSPDGSGGMLADLGGRLFSFGRGGGEAKDQGLRGYGPIRYSSTGKHVAFVSDEFDRQLRVLAADGPQVPKDVPEFSPRRIRAEEGGMFLLTGTPLDPKTGERASHVSGARYDPATGKLTELWRAPGGDALIDGDLLTQSADFDPSRMLGVVTDYRLVTRVLDLRNKGHAVLTIDNSENYVGHRDQVGQPKDPTDADAAPAPRGDPPGWGDSISPAAVVAAVLALLLVVGFCYGRLRRRR